MISSTVLNLSDTTVTKEDVLPLLNSNTTTVRLYNVEGLDHPDVASALSNLPALRELDIRETAIGLDDRVLDLNNSIGLRLLHISGIDLKYIPNIDRCTNLERIRINVRMHNGEREDYYLDPLEDVDWSLLTKVSHLNLSDNGIEGTIPEWIGSMTGLVRLELQRNRFSGNIPSTISNLQRLRVLELRDNRLTGGLNNIKNMPYLEEIYVDDNRFKGKIPASLLRSGSKADRDRTIYLRDNNFDPQELPTRLKKGIEIVVDPGIRIPPSEQNRWSVEKTYDDRLKYKK